MFTKLQQRSHDIDLEIAGTKVRALHSAVKMYYDRNCAAMTFVQPTIAGLVAQGYLPTSTVITVSDVGVPVINVVNPGASSVRFEYSLDYANEGDARQVETAYRNTTRDGLRVTWTFGNHALEEQSGIESRQLMNAFNAGVCG